MLAVQIETRRISVAPRRMPRRPKGYSLIRLLCGGICNTDLELLRGYYGYSGIPGHEFVGEVVESESRELVGQRVVGEINLSCRKCGWCNRGLGRHCPSRRVLGIVNFPGAFREFLTLPDANLHIVPRAIPTDVAVFTEPIAAACEILDQSAIPEGESVAVLGDGKLGLLIAQVLQVSGLRVHHFGRHAEKLRIARNAGVATEVMRGTGTLPQAAYRFVVDATGSRDGLLQAVRMTQPRGTVFLKSTVHGLMSLDVAPIIVNEITLVGSRCGRFEPALQLLESRAIRVEEMISESLPLSSAQRAFRLARKSGVLKVLLH